MESQVITIQNRALASKILDEAFLDFLLSRQAMMCTPQTIKFYKFTLGKVLIWFIDHGIDCPEKISSRDIRAFLGEMVGKKYSDTYINGYARAIRTFVKFLQKEKYIFDPIEMEIPKLAKKRLPVFGKVEIQNILKSCATNKRDTAFILLMVDSGLRRAEVIALNWGDVDISSGIVRVEKGKGRKARSVVIGIHTRRALLKYRNEVDCTDLQPVFQTRGGGRFSEAGIRSWLLRISKRAGIHISPHALRRTFATLSLRAGMNVFQLQGLLGHSSLEMTRHYVEMLDEDLVKAHREHGPIDNLFLG